jgi:Flp pilus assembly protein TadD
MVVALLGLAAAGAWLFLGLTADRDARLARTAVAAGRFDEADPPLARWVRARPENAEAWYLKARVAAGRGQPNEAIRYLERARSLGHPEEPTGRLMGLLLARTGRTAEAEPLLRRALASSTRPEPEVARELARIYLESYRIDAAAAVLERWMRDAPRDATPHLWQVEVDKRSEAEAKVIIAHYRAALERDPGLDRARLGLADTLRSEHRNDEAAVEYAAYLERHPEDPAALLGAGINTAEMGDDGTARARLRKAAELAPDDPRAFSELAAIALRRNDPAEALSLLDQAIRIEPNDYELRYRRRVVLERQGRHEQAREEQRQIERLRASQARIKELHDRLARSPGDAQLQYEVATWMIENGHEEEGLRWAERTLRDRPDHAPTHRLLADYYTRRGQMGLANYHRLRGSSGGGTGPTPP